MLDKDTASTVALGAYGLLLLQSVQWDRTWPFSGETVKAIVALIMIPVGYLMYRKVC